MVEGAVLRWTGHVTRMSNDRIPKKLLYGRLASGKGSRGNQATYVNQVRRTLNACGIPPVNLEVLAAGRAIWRSTCKAGIERAESDRINRLIDKRERRKRIAGLVPTHQPS